MGFVSGFLTLASENFVQKLALLLILFLTYYLFIYPFHINPLHQIPGPAHYKISKVFILNDQRVESRNQKVDSWHRKYGTIIQIAPNEVSFSSVKSLKEVYIKKNLDKSSFYSQFSNFDEKNAFSLNDRKQHLDRKKLMTKLYTKTSVFSDLSQKHLNAKVNNVKNFLKVRLGIPVDVYELFNSLAMDVVTYYEFGSKFTTDLVSDLPARDIIKSFRASSSMWFYTTLLPRLWSWAASKEIAERSDESRIWTETIFLKAYEALENGETAEELSLIRILYDLGVSKWAIASELFDHVAAGHETTGTSLAYATWQLSRPCNKYIQDKLYHELKQNFGDLNDNVDLSKLDKLVYLEAVVSELTRLHAAIPGAEPREVTKSGQLQVELSNGRIINLPKGTVVSVQPWTVQRDQSIFASPDIFKPERWLQQEDETEDEFKKRYHKMKSAMFAFGQGSRMCLGMNIALIEMKLCIANLYYNYRSSVSTQWCKSNQYSDGGVLMGAYNLTGLSKDNMRDVELMAMADSYTSRPIFDECWLEWSERA